MVARIVCTIARNAPYDIRLPPAAICCRSICVFEINMRAPALLCALWTSMLVRGRRQNRSHVYTLSLWFALPFIPKPMLSVFHRHRLLGQIFSRPLRTSPYMKEVVKFRQSGQIPRNFANIAVKIPQMSTTHILWFILAKISNVLLYNVFPFKTCQRVLLFFRFAPLLSYSPRKENRPFGNNFYARNHSKIQSIL